MVNRCRTCRFWQLDLRSDQNDSGEDMDSGFGWCRLRPPMIIDHMARMAIRQPGFGGNFIDREDVANAMEVENATMFPATFGTNWCGQYQALPADSVEGAAA